MARRLYEKVAKHFKQASFPDALYPRHSAGEQGTGLHRPAILHTRYPSWGLEFSVRIPPARIRPQGAVTGKTGEWSLDLHLLVPGTVSNIGSIQSDGFWF